jgi:hypothetical protein
VYWQAVVNRLLEDSSQIRAKIAAELAQAVSELPVILQAAGEQTLLEICLRHYDIHTSYKQHLDVLLAPFSMRQLARAYVAYKKRRFNANEVLEFELLGGLFWLLEHKDPEFKWAYWEQTPKYPLYDPWTSDTLDPKTGVPVRPKKY